NTATIGKASKQQLIGKCTTNRVLNKTMHGTRAHRGVKAFVRQILTQLLGEANLNFLVVKLSFKLKQEFIDHPQHHLFGKRRKADNAIEAITEFRRKETFNIRHFVPRLMRICKANTTLV